MNPQRHEWTTEDFVAGALCLELTNTVGDHSKTRDVERLTDWDTLLKWTVATGVLRATEAQELRKIGSRDPASVQRALQSLLKFREALFRTASALAADGVPVREDLDKVEATILSAVRSAHLVRQGERFEWAVGPIDSPVNLPLSRVALSALSLLQGKELAYLRECRRCSWLFVDRSKSHGRRWCRADACGNRARVARHYHARSN
jgi:predicted RNA-binding Zn ribbon-like protein